MRKFLQQKAKKYSARMLLGFISLVILGTTNITAQVSFTQTSNTDFYKGAYNDMLVVSDNVYLPYQADDVNNWLTTTVLPQTLEGHKAATWNNRYVYVTGGFNDLTYSGSVYRATLTTGGISSWTTLNSLPVGLRDHAVVIGTNTIYVLGGRDDTNIYNEIYFATINTDGSIGDWQTSATTLPATLWGHTAVYCNGYIYIAGGSNVSTATSALNTVYYAKVLADNTLSSFTATTALPQTRNGQSMVVDGNKIYVIAGFANGGAKTNTIYYATSGSDGTLGAWSSETALPITVSNHSSVIMNGLITVLAGESGGTLSNSVYYADINTSPLTWNLATNVMYDRTKDGAAFAANGWIGYCGGENLSGTPIHNSRYATLNLTTDFEKRGFFVSSPFYELGAERTITELTFTASNPAVSNTEIAYRTAGDDLDWGNWSALTATSPITIGITDHYLQYKVVFTGDGIVTPVFNEMNLWTPGTELSGDLNSLILIDLANSPYWVTDDVSFTSGTHTFEAGVVWNFLPQTGLTVGQANMICNGTSGNQVQFIGYTNDDGLWDGIYFDPNSDNGVSSQFNYVVIANGGYGSNNANLYCNSSNEPFLNHCTIRNADGNGIRLNSSHINVEYSTIEYNSENGIYLENSNPTFFTCDIQNNSAAGVYFTSNTSEPTYSSTNIQNNLYGFHYPSPNFTIYPPNGSPSLINNTYNGIVISGGDVTNGNKVWNSVIYDYILLGTVTIKQYINTVRLTIEPGNTIKVVSGAQLQVGSQSNGGELYAIGTADSTITFTSYNGASGGWDGIYFHDYSDAYNTAPSILDYCVIENGNEYNYYASNTTHVQISNSTIQNGLVDGARYLNSYGTIQSCNFINNTRYPLYFTDWQASPVHDMNTMSGNQVDMIVLEGGQYSGDRTFSYDNGLHYLALNDLLIAKYISFATLTIEPGVTFEFQTGTQLQVGSQSNGGNLFAEGTSGSPITFKAFNDTPGGWEGIYFHSYSDSYGSSSSMKYCIIEQGNDYNVFCDNTTEPFFENCTFRNSVNDGLREISSSPEVYACQFLNNGAYPINYLDWACNSHLQGNSYSGNNPDYIALSGGQYSDNRTLYNDGIPYHVLSDIILGTYISYRTMTIEPGVTLEFDPGTSFQVGLQSNGGSLIANGNQDSIITFKPYNNVAGGWEGIYFHDYSDSYGSTSSMQYCSIEKCNNYNMYCESTIQPATLENCTFTNAYGDGLRLYNSTIGIIKNSTFSDNGGYGIYLDGSSNPDIGNDPAYTCNIFGNGPYEVYNNTANNIDARYNYWGTGDSAMIAQRIYDYYDNTVNGIVIFEDFAQVPSLPTTNTLLSGNVWYNNAASTDMENALMEIFDFGGSPISSTNTNTSGYYSFGSFSSGNYTMDITPDDVWGGVNSTDALLILNHFAHIDTLEGMELAASDVNYSQTVNGTDALFVMKRYTGMISSFPSGDWFYNTANLTINGNQVVNDFAMLCFGDVNSSYTPAKKDKESVLLVYEGTQIIQSFTPFDLTVSIKDMIEAGAVSLGLVYPEEYFEITGAELLNTSGSAIFTTEDGLFRIAYADLNGVGYTTGEDMLILHCTAKDLSLLQEPILVELYEESEFADPAAQVIDNVTLVTPELATMTVGMNNNAIEGLWLSENYPNPFSNNTTIHYQIPEYGYVNIKVYDITGNMVKELVDSQLKAGEYTVGFSSEDLEPGVYFYKLEFSNSENHNMLVNKMSVTR